MNNEPVAWINQNIDVDNGKPQLAWHKDNFAEICKPLYTHPANHKYDPETGEPLIDGYPLFSGLPPLKTLTDEEIWEIFQETQHHAMDFARAILKKASEK